jgi:hypothetical protein
MNSDQFREGGPAGQQRPDTSKVMFPSMDKK